MFGMGWPEMVLILAVALIFIGPKKLPDLAKSLGRALGEFKKATNDFKESISMDSTLNDVKDEFKDMGKKLKEPLSDSSGTYQKDPGDYSKAESATASETVDAAPSETNNSDDSQASNDQPTPKTVATSDTENELSKSGPAETGKAVDSDAAASSGEPASSPADTESDDSAGPVKTSETGNTTVDTTFPDATSEGPLKDA